VKPRPTLFQTIVREHLWATGLAVGLLLLGLVLAADFANLASRQRALAKDLRSIESVDIDSVDSVETLSRGKEESRGFILVDEDGHWAAGRPSGRESASAQNASRWDRVEEVMKKGELEGVGKLPWISEPVVWAARVMYDPDGQRVVLVQWHHIRAVRAAVSTMYALVVVAAVLAAAVSLGVALRTGRRIARVLDSIADSSTRMAAGDYRVHLPSQTVAELDRVSAAVNRLARDLQAEHDRLQRLERLQRQFVADAAHELRAPLTAMRVTMEAWLDGVLAPEEQPAALVRLQREIEHLSGMVTKLLDLSRIESGREPLTLGATDLAAVAAEVVSAFRQLPGASITLDFPAALPPAWADPQAVRRVLQNLLENARRFTPASGSIRVWGAHEGRKVRLAVTDTGCGIAPDFLPRVWERFARGAEATAEGRPGAGLGLAIVKALVEAMGGEVGAESSPGCGTTVWALLATPAQELPSG
jgi:signal transduction histidine kinase